MSQPFMGEIRLMAFTYAPRGWAMCNGQIMAISQNSALFSLLGTYYGGNGQTTFALPDFRGRLPVHQGQGNGLAPRTLGEISGQENVTLTTPQIPMHNHPFAVPATSEDATLKNPVGNAPASTGTSIYGPAAQGEGGAQSVTGVAGGSQAHNNMQPYLVVNFCIALEGIYPSRN